MAHLSYNTIIVSVRNISTVILYRPDHICQDRFCRDSTIEEYSAHITLGVNFHVLLRNF